MITVHRVSTHVYKIILSDDAFDSVNAAAVRIDGRHEDVLQGWLMFVVSIWDKVDFLERSQDGLDGKNEGMGRG